MYKTLKAAALASAVTLSGAVTASAGLIDFTNNASLSTAEYTVVGYRLGVPVQLVKGVEPPGAISPIAGLNDGLGIRNDEIDFPTEWITITFVNPVTLIGAYFLDVFFSGGGRNTESANVVKGTVPFGPPNASVNALVPTSEGKGFASITGIALKGTTFTFYAGPGKDDTDGDIALAAIQTAPIPLPAGILLFGTALGALGLARRRKRA